MSFVHHPLRAIWKIGRDARQASASHCIFALVAVGLLFQGGLISNRLPAVAVQSEELPDSQSPTEEINETLVLASSQQRRSARDRVPAEMQLGRNLDRRQDTKRCFGSALVSIRPRSAELLGRNGCGAALRC